MEKLVYLIRTYTPKLFDLILPVAHAVTGVLYGRRMISASNQGKITGKIHGEPATLSPLSIDDLDELHQFLDRIPESHLEHFRPHGFERVSLSYILRSSAFLKYGLFVKGQIRAYSLLKASPTGSGFIGQLVDPAYTGIGIGKLLVHHLYWQAWLAGLKTRATISQDNQASLRSHGAVADYQVIAELPNNYLMIEFPRKAVNPPEILL